MTETFDIIVIGAGVAGVMAAAALAPAARVLLLERETAPGYHASGRSAAVFAPNYGSGPMQALTTASLPFFTAPPEGTGPLLSPRPFLFIARDDQRAALPEGLERISGPEAEARAPLLRPGYTAEAALNPGASDIDVHEMMQGALRRLRAAGGRLVTGAEVTALTARAPGWQVETRAGVFAAPVLVNAAGAWLDEIARLAGLPPRGLTPMRRSAALVSAPEDVDVPALPMLIDAEEQFYVKPDAGKLMVSPADETPSPPCDAQPEELDLAIGIDRASQACRLEVRRLEGSWAGLRSFAPDRLPICGFDAGAAGFFWLGGQGGTGVQTAPALAALTAALVTGQPPEDPALANSISPNRPALR